MFSFDGPPGFVRDGSADSLETAKDAVERNWLLWLAAAGLDENTDDVLRGIARQVGNI